MALRVDERIAELLGEGLFTDPQWQILPWTHHMSVDEVVALFQSFPVISTIWDAGLRQRVLNRIREAALAEGDVIHDPWMLAMYCVTRIEAV